MGKNFLLILSASTLIIIFSLLTSIPLQNKHISSSLQSSETLGVENYLAQSCTEPSGGCGSNYYWNSTTCSCQSSCQAPSSGCGSNYYWDSASCSCRPYPTTTTCQPPSSGCGTNYYWDSSACYCRAYESCSPPSSGCGTNNYWDSTSCSCKSSSTCQPPSSGCETNKYWDYASCSCISSSGGSGSGGTSPCATPSSGCGTNNYWDSSSCSCKSSSGTNTCSPPSSGCGSNYYWDSYGCMCKSQNSTCYPPTSGCGSSSYWDSYYCSCRPYSTATTNYCSPPSSGCGYNYYWDQYSCSCRYYTSSCVPPPSGCGTNNYWDYYSCSCKDYQPGTTTSCVQPASGCGYNYFWDSSSCLCKSNPNITTCPQPTPGCASNTYWDTYSCTCKSTYPYYQQENFDRLAYESSERVVCVKALLSSYEYERLRYFVPSTPSDQDEIYKLGNKVKSCWGETTTQAEKQNMTTRTTFNSPLDYEGCVIKSLGETSYREIYSGVKAPTYEEHLKYEACYKGETKTSTVTYYTSEDKIPKSTEACLRTVLSGGLYEKIKGGKSEVPYELKDKVNRCFGINPQAFEEARAYKVPDKIKGCLEDSIGETRFNEINSGVSRSTDAERTRGEACFSKLNREQLKFLPPPSEEVHFLEENPDLVEVSDVEQETQEVKSQTLGGKIVFTGQALANSAVYIYIYSTEPIVVTTKADENGDWVYELDQPLKGEKHIAYAVVRSDKGKDVRSLVFDFTVVASEQDIQNRLLSETLLTRDTGKNFVVRVLVLVIVFSVLTLFGVATYKASRKKSSAPKTEKVQENNPSQGA